MNIYKDTINILEKIDKINVKVDNSSSLSTLYTKSIHIIKYILNNINIQDIHYHTINKHNINNITLHLLKNCIKLPNDTQLYNFIVSLKNGSLTKDEINVFTNRYSDKISSFVEYLLKKNKSEKLSYLIHKYSTLIISKFVPIDIQTNILKLTKYITFSVHIDNNILYFKIFYENQIDNKELLLIIINALFTIYIYDKHDITIYITIFLTNNKKKFPKTYNFLGSLEINSGLTSFEKKNHICIFRKEELHKLIIHEMIHALELDMNIFMNPNIQFLEDKLIKKFNINVNQLKLNESYTESCTLIIHSLIVSVLSFISIDKVIKNEIKFSITQCSNILYFFNISPNVFRKKNIDLSNWNEKTAVLSYYFFKLVNIYNIEEFITLYMFNFNMDMSNYIYFLENNIKKIEFLENNIHLNHSLKMILYKLV